MTQVDHARFGCDLPDSIELSEINIEVGTNMAVWPTPSHAAQSLMWDGSKGIDHDEFARLITEGKLVRGPMFMRSMGLGVSASPSPSGATAPHLIHTSAKSEWERHVEQFRVNYALSEAQSKSARGVLEDCVRQANDLFAHALKADADAHQRR